MTGGMTAVLSCLMLFSCSDDEFLDGDGAAGITSDNICFGIAPGDGAASRGMDGVEEAAGAATRTTGRFVLRGAATADTLCVQATVTDGIASSPLRREVVSRAAPMESVGDFHVQAVLTASNTFYMNDVAKSRGNDLWSTEKVYYWPGEGHDLKFYAWAPAGAFTPPAAGETELNYTVPADVANQSDLVVATPVVADGNKNSAVSLTFKHICTAVKFVVGSQMQPGTIQRISLKGVYGGGTYDMESGTWQLTTSSTVDFSQTLSKEMSGSDNAETPITEAAQTFMMLPHSTLPEGATIEVEFVDQTTNETRSLSASIAGSQWPQGQTVTYKLSITPEYELEFISEPEIQDAHYVIYPIHIKAGEIPGGWTMTSTDPDNVTLRTDLTILTRRGFWIEEDKGAESISSETVGEDITVYAFLAENVSEATREVKLELRPTSQPNAQPQTFTISQLCPSWNDSGLGCERLEDGDYPWGFLWDNDMVIRYDAEQVDFVSRIILFFYVGLFNNDEFVRQDISIIPYYHHVVVDFGAVSPLNKALSDDDGKQNTWDVYNFDGINDASSMMEMLEEWGLQPDKELPTNPTEFAARACALKNKFNKEVAEEQGQTVERAVLKKENLVWYLPARNEAPQMRDEEYPLSGDYWTSTAAGSGDNEDAYKYTVGGTTSLERRDTELHVRAVRKRP